MPKFPNLAAGLAALSSAAALAAAPAAAQPFDWSAYDASRAGTVAERLVLCDLSAYLGTNPDPHATRVYVRRDDHRFELLLPPYISSGGQWYEEDLERAYRRYREAGLVTRDQLFEAQDRYVRPMTRAFERSGVREQRFLQSQDRFCRDLARAAPR